MPLKKINPGTYKFITKETIKGLPEATKKVKKAIFSVPKKIARGGISFVMGQIKKDIDFKRKMAKPSKEIQEHYKKIRRGK